jgi:HK97 family phage prohead protease
MFVINSEGLPDLIRYESSIFEPTAFTNWLSNGGDQRVRFLFQHGDADQGFVPDVPLGVNALPIGTISGIEPLADGLHFEASFASHQLAQAVRELSDTGGLKELSVAILPRTVELRNADGHVFRHVTEAELYDISVVVWGQFGLNATITEVFSSAAAQALAENGDAESVPAPVDSVADETERAETIRHARVKLARLFLDAMAGAE